MKLKEKPNTSHTMIPAIIVISVGAILLNGLYFLALVSSPVIRSDAWRFVDKLLMKWNEVGFSLADLFFKKHILKTALPFHKISLYLDYRLFDLSFRLEALIGFFSICVICTFTTIIYLRHIQETRRSWISAGIFLCAILMLTSMNVTEAYTWSLVTFAYSYFVIALGIAYVLWNANSLPVWFTSLLLVCCFFLLGDSLSIILWLALAVAMSIACINDKTRSVLRTGKWLGFTAILVGSYYVAINFQFIFFENPPVGVAKDGSSVAWNEVATYIEIVRIVFSSVLVHKGHLPAFGEHATSITYLLGAAALALYLRFFAVLLLSKSPLSTQKFLSLVLVLYGTASILGILIGRTSVWGIWTLHETRYLIHSQIIAFALLVDLSFELASAKGLMSRAKKAFLACTVLGITLSQLIFFKQAHVSIPWLQLYQEKQVRAIGDYAINTPPEQAECSGFLTTLCSIPYERRLQVLSFIERNRLNVFSPSIQLRHRISPYDTAENTVRVEDWGPREVNLSRLTPEPLIFLLNVSRLNQFGQYAILLNDVEMPTVVFGSAISFTVTNEQLDVQEPLSITLLDKKYGHRQSVGTVTTTR